jgi:hypothetical protein
VYRMTQIRSLDAEFISIGGQPSLRSIFWKGERPGSPPKKHHGIILGCLIGLALLFAAIFAYWALQERERHFVGTVPPHEVKLRSLILDGPGDNRHVTLTDFDPGGYSFESKSGRWTHVWIALFPSDVPPTQRREIKVVLESREVEDEAALVRLLQGGRVSGICSPAPISSWGATLGPNLRNANQGCSLSSAWSIEELRELPSAARVWRIFASSAGCYAAVLLLSTIVFMKSE